MADDPFATDDMMTHRLKTLGSTAKDDAVEEGMKYGHGVVVSILIRYDITAGDIDGTETNYELLQNGEADISAGYLYQSSPPSTDDHVYTEDNPHIMVSTGVANVKRWAEDYLEATTGEPRAKVTHRQISARNENFLINNYS